MRIGGVFLLEPISPADWDSVAHFWLLFFIWPKRCSMVSPSLLLRPPYRTSRSKIQAHTCIRDFGSACGVGFS